MDCPCCAKTKAHNKLVPHPGGRYICSREHTFKFVSPNPDMTGRNLVVTYSPDGACEVGEEFPIPDDVVLNDDGSSSTES